MSARFTITNPLKEIYKTKTNVILLAHTLIGTIRGKSANGLIIHDEIFNVVAIIDKNAVGKLTSEICLGVNKNIPIYPDVDIALSMHNPKALIILTNPEPYWHNDIKIAIKNKLDIINTSFNFINNTPSIKTLIDFYNVRYFDLRNVSHLKAYPNGKNIQRKSKVILVAGTDCSIGKRTTAMEIKKEAVKKGIKTVMLATGQTGLMIGEPGTCIDSLIMEFSNGIISELVKQLDDKGYELIIIEGQSDIYHPAYSVGTLALLHGSNPDGVILAHDENRKYHEGFDKSKLYLRHSLIRYIEGIKMMSLPCGPVYETIGIATIGEENIKSINKMLNNKDIVVTDVKSKAGATLLLDKILEHCNINIYNEVTSHSLHL